MENRCSQTNCTLAAFQSQCKNCNQEYCSFHKNVHQCQRKLESLTSINRRSSINHASFNQFPKLGENEEVKRMLTQEMMKIRQKLIKRIEDLSQTYLSILIDLNSMQYVGDLNNYWECLKNYSENFDIRGNSKDSIVLKNSFIEKLKSFITQYSGFRFKERKLQDYPKDENKNIKNYSSSISFNKYQMKKSPNTDTRSIQKSNHPFESVAEDLNQEYSAKGLSNFFLFKKAIEYFKVCKLDLIPTIFIAIFETVKMRIYSSIEFEAITNLLNSLIGIEYGYVLSKNSEYSPDFLKQLSLYTAKFKDDYILNFKKICGIYCFGEKPFSFPAENSVFDVFLENKQDSFFIYIPFVEFQKKLRVLVIT